PGMDIEDATTALLRLLEGALDQSEWQLTQIPAARRGQLKRTHHPGGERKLDEGAAGTIDPIRRPGRAGIAITRSANREDARLVAVAGFHEDVERPFGATHDREARCAEAVDRRASGIFQRRFRAADFIRELAPIEGHHSAMRPTVGCDLVAARHDGPN